MNMGLTSREVIEIELVNIARKIDFMDRLQIHSENFISMLCFDMLAPDEQDAIYAAMEDRNDTGFSLRAEEEFLHQYAAMPTDEELVNDWNALSNEARWEIQDEFHEQCARGTADEMYFYPLLMWPERYPA